MQTTIKAFYESSGDYPDIMLPTIVKAADYIIIGDDCYNDVFNKPLGIKKDTLAKRLKAVDPTVKLLLYTASNCILPEYRYYYDVPPEMHVYHEGRPIYDRWNCEEIDIGNILWQNLLAKYIADRVEGSGNIYSGIFLDLASCYQCYEEICWTQVNEPQRVLKVPAGTLYVNTSRSVATAKLNTPNIKPFKIVTAAGKDVYDYSYCGNYVTGLYGFKGLTVGDMVTAYYPTPAVFPKAYLDQYEASMQQVLKNIRGLMDDKYIIMGNIGPAYRSISVWSYLDGGYQETAPENDSGGVAYIKNGI